MLAVVQLGGLSLLPVMVNLLLLNTLFSVGVGALVAASLITLCLLFYWTESN